MKKSTKKDTTAKALPFGIADLKFIKAAMSPKSPRGAFTCAWLKEMRGSLWLVATDAHRLHGLRVVDNWKASAKDGWNDTPVDMKMLMGFAALKGWKSFEFLPSSEAANVELFCSIANHYDEINPDDITELMAKDLWRLRDMSDVCPPIEKIVPTEFEADASGIAFNAKYLSDCKDMGYSNRVVLHSSGKNRAALIVGTAKDPKEITLHRTIAIVMPMSAE